MRAVGTPVVVDPNGTRQLDQIKIGGDGPHNERWLQELIFEHPSLLPIDQIEPGLSRLIPICMELPLRCGYLDNLFLTPDGDIVIVEVKLWRNPEMRRAVLAQALDYASAMFDMTYDDLDQAAQKAEGTDGRTLFELVDGPETLDEASLIDAVIHNLKTGRIVVLVVGDGIRGELESLASGLQSHAGFRFTFAMVELSIFQSQEPTLIVVPRTLVSTHRIERGVIRIEGDAISATISTAETMQPNANRPAETLSSDAFFDAMEAIDIALPSWIAALLQTLEPLGVYPEFKKSLILRWAAPNGNIVNLACILKGGQVWTDYVASSLGNRSAAVAFLNSLANGFGYDVGETAGQPILKNNGKTPKIVDMVKYPERFAKAVEVLSLASRDL